MQSTKDGRKGTIVMSEEEPEVRNYLIMALETHGYRVESADTENEVVELLRNTGQPASAILLAMPPVDGLSTVRKLRRENEDLPLILLANPSSPVTAAEALKSGATDFLYKPVTHDTLCKSLNRVLGDAWTEHGGPAPPTSDALDEPHNVGWTRRSEDFVRKVGPADVPVLILGETGTGKEVLARRIHARSMRARKPFIKLNCAALPPELVESELFGYDRGAFTGAFQKKAGMFEQADGGTLLLDEIGDMDHKLQAKLLHVLQDRSFQHLGGKETVSVDVRVIAATHRDLESAISEGTFREDLYYRLNVISIHVPPLRDRRDEIVPLAEHFLKKYLAIGDSAPLVPVLIRSMLDYAWPGNIRELENRIRSYIVMGDAESLAFELQRKQPHAERRPFAVHAAPAPAPAPSEGAETSILHQVNRTKELAEIEAILAALNATHWNRKQAAANLGVDYKALLYRMKKLNIEDSAVPAIAREPVPLSARVGKPAELRERACAAPKKPKDRTFAAGAAVQFMLALAVGALLPALRDCPM
jgi:two-component system response regulator AtoC